MRAPGLCGKSGEEFDPERPVNCVSCSMVGYFIQCSASWLECRATTNFYMLVSVNPNPIFFLCLTLGGLALAVLPTFLRECNGSKHPAKGPRILRKLNECLQLSSLQKLWSGIMISVSHCSCLGVQWQSQREAFLPFHYSILWSCHPSECLNLLLSARILRCCGFFCFVLYFGQLVV